MYKRQRQYRTTGDGQLEPWPKGRQRNLNSYVEQEVDMAIPEWQDKSAEEVDREIDRGKFYFNFGRIVMAIVVGAAAAAIGVGFAIAVLDWGL